MVGNIANYIRKNESSFFVLLLLLIAAGICWSLLRNQSPATYDHDFSMAYHLAMRHYFGRGQFLPVWVPDFNHGYGGAVFNFYPPLFFLCSAFLDALGVPSALALNLASIGVMFLSGWAMFIFLKELINREGAFLGAAAYMMAPYHTFDLFDRGAYPEFTAFIFLPLIWLGIRKVMRSPCFENCAITAGALAGLLLSHTLTALVFLPLTFLYVLYEGLMQKEGRLKKWAVALSAMPAGFALAAFSVLPAVMDKKYMIFEPYVNGWYDYRRNFIHPLQLFLSPDQYSPWLPVSLANKQPFEFGWLYVSVFCIGIVCVCSWGSKDIKKVFIYFLAALLFTLWMMMIYSRVVWGWFPILRVIQFPWRLMELATFFVCLFIASIGLIPWGRYRRAVCLSLVALIILVRMGDLKPLGWFAPVSDPAQILSAIENQGTDAMPLTAKYDITSPPEHLLDFPQGMAEIVAHQENSPVEHTFQVLAQTPVLACFYNYYFPGWEIEIDGRKSKFINNEYGLMLFILQPGAHRINIHFAPTPEHMAGNLISLLSLAGMILALVLKRTRKGRACRNSLSGNNETGSCR